MIHPKLIKHKISKYFDNQLTRLLSKRPVVIKSKSSGAQLFNSYNDRVAGISKFLQEVVQLQQERMEASEGYNNNLVKQKAITIGEASKALVSLSPDFALYHNFYSRVPGVAAAVDRKANYLAQAGWKIVDKNGNENKELTQVVKKNFDIDKMIITASKQYDVYSTVFYVKIQKRDNKGKLIGKPKFVMPAASDIFQYRVDMNTLEISQFIWDSPEVRTYKAYEKYDEFGDQTFHIGKNSDTNSLFFGSPRLRSLTDVLDKLFLNSENYKIFLSNASMPGILVLTSEETSDTAKEQVQSAFAALRDKRMRHRAQVIEAYKTNPDTGESVPTVQFTNITPQIGERLKLEEEKEIAGQVYDCLGVPRKMMGMTTSGIGANEYESARQDYIDNAIRPYAYLISDDFNQFIWPSITEFLKNSGYFERNEYVYSLDRDQQDREIVANADDYHFEFNDFDSVPDYVKVQEASKMLENGQITDAFFLTKFLGVKENELPIESGFRTLKNNIVLVAEGKLMDTYGNQIAKELNAEVEVEGDVEDFQEAENENPLDIDGIVKNKTVWTKVKSSKNKKKASNFFATSQNFKQGISVIPDLFETEQFGDLQKYFTDLLKKQAEKIKFEALREKYGITSGNLEKEQYEALKADILQEVKEIMPKLTDLLDRKQIDSLAVALTYFAKLGYDYGMLQTPEDIKEMEPEERVKVQEEVSDWLSERVTNLLEGQPEPEGKKSFKLTPYFDGDLDNTSEKIITEAVISGTSDLEFEKQLEDRSRRIAEEESSKSFAAGLLAYAFVKDARFKKFLPTTAKEPRGGTHGSMVGTVVPINDNFPDGTFWSQELINCQHGVEILWEKE